MPDSWPTAGAGIVVIEKLIEPLAAALVHRWIGYATGPALLFWLAGAWATLGAGRRSLDCPAAGSAVCWAPAGWLRIAWVVLVTTALVIGSSLLVSHLARQMLRAFTAVGWTESAPGRWIAAPLAAYHRCRRSVLVEQCAAAKSDRVAAARWLRARRYPSGEVLPTWIGNAFAATGQRMIRRYGLDLGVCWGLLVMVVPEPVRQRLETTLAPMLARAQALLWSVLAGIWVVNLGNAGTIAVWLGVTVVAALVSYAGLHQAVGAFCDLVEDVVSLHHVALYDALGLHRPQTTGDAPARGALLVAYLQHAPIPAQELAWPPPVPAAQPQA